MFLIKNDKNEAISVLLRGYCGNCFKNILSGILISSLKMLRDASEGGLVSGYQDRQKPINTSFCVFIGFFYDGV
ncbi:hypothetical protein DFP94_11557 [Fontibacillus phaseoli]|uniref:Uncharacterized protein n=1 Tax=Fontibacillus phaseoli TaxID=1416533 RepID=A0A369B1R1_9BACL|nr:hypothetical protein DFP94_11557 [Fontibacillus phaseoli]